MKIAITGHRPEKVRESAVRYSYRDYFERNRTEVAITGLASGVDLWAADEARLLGIEIWSAKPWAGHKPRLADAELYAKIIKASSRVVAVNEAEEYPGVWVYQKRNEWMVDHADYVVAFWDGSDGGTKNCVDYSKKVNTHGRNIYVPF